MKRLRAAKKCEVHWDSGTSIPAASPNSAAGISLQAGAWNSSGKVQTAGEFPAQEVFWVSSIMNVRYFHWKSAIVKKK